MTASEFTEFPHVESPGEPVSDLDAWFAANRERLLGIVEQAGAVLLRDFPLQSDHDFDGAVSAFDLPLFTYAGSLSNAVRKHRTEKVFTANEAPPDIEIFLHHEMAQTPLYPGKLFFFCERAAEQGGATPLCRSDLLLKAMQRRMPRFVDKCRSAGLKYTNVMPAEADTGSGQGRSWKSTLNCDTGELAQDRLAELGYSWQWRDDGSLKVTTPVLPATRILASGTEVFFNQLIAAFMGWQDSRNVQEKSVRFGDDTEVSDADMEQVAALAESLSFDLQWRNGDMALVDNFLVMHGRRPYRGERRVLVSLVA